MRRKTEKNIRDSFHGRPIKDLRRNIEIANNFNRYLVDKVTEGYDVVLPYKLGTLSIIGRKPKLRFREDGTPVLPPDWVGTKKLWDSNPEAKEKKTLLYHTNEHTDGVIYKYFWSKKRVLVSYKKLYNLVMTREHKRAVHHLIKQGKEYFVKIK